MTVTAAHPHSWLRRASRSSHGGLAFDVLLAVGCLVATLVVNLGGSESVAANREPDALTLAFTVLAVGSIALRRRYPVAVLLLTLAGVFGLVLVKGTVGIATIGPFIATYTAVATGPSRNARRAVGIVAVALVLAWLLDPVDLSPEGAVSNTAVFAAVILLGSSARARRERSDAAVEAADQRAARTATQERLRITRELHDVLGHAMSVMVVQAGAAGRLLDTHDAARAREAVAEIERTGRRSMAEMRHLLGILRDGEPDAGETPRAPAPTLEDLGALVDRIRESGLPTSVSVHGTRGDVPAGIDLAAYRIVQEALTNCLKHAGATTAWVGVDYGTDEVAVEVVDDGHGASGVVAGGDPAGGSVAGHGVAGMRERVAMYDGVLVVGDRPEGGFRVRATFPLAASP